jgi:HK97 family phage portal protein
MRAGKTMILEAGMKYEQIPMAPGDAQLLETRGHNIEEICRWFRTPPIMVGHGDKQSSWPTSTEAQGRLFLTYTLAPWLKRIEQSVRRSLLRPEERQKVFAEFNVDALLRADLAARAQFYASALQNGYINRATVANQENLPPPTGGDIFTVQSNLVPIDQLGAAKPADQVRSALRNWLLSEETPDERSERALA